MFSQKVFGYLTISIYMLSYLSLSTYGEILSEQMKGLYYELDDPVRANLEGNLPGTTLSIFGENKNTLILYKDEKENIIYAFLPPCKGVYRVTITTETDGFRSLCNAEVVDVFKSENIRAKYAEIKGTGTRKVTVARDEPKWAIKSKDDYIIEKDFQPDGINLPITYNMTDLGIYTVKPGDYLLFTGMLKAFTDTVSVKLGDEYYGRSPIQLSIMPTDPFFKVQARMKDIKVKAGTMERNLIGTYPLRFTRFTVVLVCEHLGWRIYFNGEEVYFYYDRFNRKHAKTVSFFGREDSTISDWTLLKFSFRSS